MAALPDPLPMGRVLRFLDKTIETDEAIKVLAGKDEQGYFLDYYRVDNDGQNVAARAHPREWRCREARELRRSDRGGGYSPTIPRRPRPSVQRIVAHNTRVEQILRAKGFK